MSKSRGFKSLIYNTSINLENKLFGVLQILNQKDMQVRNVFIEIDENIAQCQILKKLRGVLFVTEVILIMFLTKVPIIKYSVLLKVKESSFGAQGRLSYEILRGTRTFLIQLTIITTLEGIISLMTFGLF